jgi:hypothetical protein
VEEAAVGRALANLGFALVPSRAEARAEVMVRAADVVASRPALALAEGSRCADAVPMPAAVPGAALAAVRVEPADPELRMLVVDLAALVTRAERFGIRPRRAAAWRARLRAGVDAPAVLREAEHRLRAWIERRRAEPYGGAV